MRVPSGMNAISPLCDRARRWASLRVDGELSELESALLASHLARCVDCREFARGAERVAAVLSSARLERPRRAFVVPPRAGAARARLVARSAAVAASLACVGVGVAAYEGASGAGSGQAVEPVAVVGSGDSSNELRALRRASLFTSIRSIPRNRQVPGESV